LAETQATADSVAIGRIVRGDEELITALNKFRNIFEPVRKVSGHYD
jgi:hypothetical protein